MSDNPSATEQLLAVAIEARRLLRIRSGKSISEHKLLDALDAAIAGAEEQTEESAS